LKVLIVEDEHRVSDFLNRGLTEEGHAVRVAHTGAEGLTVVEEGWPDLIILDWMLPDTEGVEVCRILRGRGVHTHILMLTARDAVEDRVGGLDAGADDYLVKPFAFEELLARIRAVTRRPSVAASDKITVGDLVVDLRAHSARRGEKDIELTPREFALLAYLIRRPGRVVSRTALMQDVWDQDFDSGTNVVDVYINYLRSKIHREDAPALIHTVRGIGYVLREATS
jgi:DNA-binding response OmpR family regulator